MSRPCQVVILLDRSGSMQSIREATVKGINDFIKEVQKEPGEGTWSFLQFDDLRSAKGAGEKFPHAVFENIPDSEVREVKLEDFIPRGGTALIDATFITVRDVKDWWLSIEKEKRPRVMIVIVTDGQENESKNFTRDELRELTAEVQSKHGFEFIYLGANQDAFAEAEKYGISKNAMGFQANSAGYQHANRSAARGTRKWKADGNPTAESLLTSAEPDEPIGG